MIRGLAIAIVSLICLMPALALASLFEQAVAGGAPEAQAKQETNIWQLNGYLRSDVFVGKDDGPQEDGLKSAYLEAALKVRAKFNPMFDFLAEFRVKGGHWEGDTEEYTDLREAYFNFRPGAFDVRVGKQIIVWGQADGFNPTNNLTPVNFRVFSPDEDDRRQANSGVRAYYNFAPLRLEAVWMPRYKQSLLPLAQLPPGVSLGDDDFPGSSDFSGGVSAIRLHLEAPSAEGSLSYLYGYATLPGLEFRGLDPASGAVLTGWTAYRQQVVGADFSTVVGGKWGLRAEAAYRQPFDWQDSQYTPNPDLWWVFGVDREFFGQLHVILQYLGGYVFDWQDVPAAPLGGLNRMIFNQTEEWQHGYSIRLAWNSIQEIWHMELTTMHNLSTGELMLRPKISHDLSDAIKLTAGLIYYTGPGDTLFGEVFDNQNSLFLEIKYSF